ncbi:hypothetical protein [Cohnella herbarum]|nr:hypothetical protein [Cohnella herbarum]
MTSSNNEPLWITADIIDPLYDRPVIDSEMDLITPWSHIGGCRVT